MKNKSMEDISVKDSSKIIAEINKTKKNERGFIYSVLFIMATIMATVALGYLIFFGLKNIIPIIEEKYGIKKESYYLLIALMIAVIYLYKKFKSYNKVKYVTKHLLDVQSRFPLTKEEMNKLNINNFYDYNEFIKGLLYTEDYREVVSKSMLASFKKESKEHNISIQKAAFHNILLQLVKASNKLKASNNNMGSEPYSDISLSSFDFSVLGEVKFAGCVSGPSFGGIYISQDNELYVSIAKIIDDDKVSSVNERVKRAYDYHKLKEVPEDTLKKIFVVK